MKKLFLSLLLPFMALAAQAQFNYNFSYQTGQTYNALPATATSVNGGLVWDEEDFGLALPFNFQWNKRITSNTLALSLGLPGIVPDSNYGTGTSISAFSAGAFGDLADKGYPNGPSRSPIRSQVTGTAPNRIYKIEMRNAGFYNDFDADSVFTDSVNLQYWLYETSNILEMRFGPSSVLNPMDYYFFADGPTILYIDSLTQNGNVKKLYYLTGAANAPTLDSATDFNDLGGLNNYPASGTVYRFTPKPNVSTGVANVLAEADCQVYPTEVANQFMISNKTATPVTYTVCAVTGQKLLSGTAAPGVQPVNIDALAAGLYLVQVQNATGSNTFRIQKK